MRTRHGIITTIHPLNLYPKHQSGISLRKTEDMMTRTEAETTTEKQDRRQRTNPNKAQKDKTPKKKKKKSQGETEKPHQLHSFI
jgi:hypothetical protein